MVSSTSSASWGESAGSGGGWATEVSPIFASDASAWYRTGYSSSPSRRPSVSVAAGDRRRPRPIATSIRFHLSAEPATRMSRSVARIVGSCRDRGAHNRRRGRCRRRETSRNEWFGGGDRRDRRRQVIDEVPGVRPSIGPGSTPGQEVAKRVSTPGRPVDAQSASAVASPVRYACRRYASTCSVTVPACPKRPALRPVGGCPLPRWRSPRT
jgi:hypothetical protein